MNSIYDIFHFLFVKWKHNTTIYFLTISTITSVICSLFQIRFEWKMRRTVFLFLTIEYIVLVFLSTVFTRRILDTSRAEYSLLWSYRWGYKVYGWNTVLLENCINIFMLMPPAILLLLFLRNKHKALYVFIVCFIISSLIELLQYSMRRGTLEIDDTIHNMLGVALVIFLYKKHNEKEI